MGTLREYNDDRTTFPEVREGQMLASCIMITLVSFLNENTNFLSCHKNQQHAPAQPIIGTVDNIDVLTVHFQGTLTTRWTNNISTIEKTITNV